MSVFITCAVTGSGDTAGKSEHVPVTPEQIADSAIDAAKAGAAVVHCHVRDPETGAPGRDIDLYREVTDRIRSSDTDVVLNLTTGMGGDIVIGSGEDQRHAIFAGVPRVHSGLHALFHPRCCDQSVVGATLR